MCEKRQKQMESRKREKWRLHVNVWKPEYNSAWNGFNLNAPQLYKPT